MIPSPAQIDQFRNDGFFLSCQILDHAMLDEIDRLHASGASPGVIDAAVRLPDEDAVANLVDIQLQFDAALSAELDRNRLRITALVVSLIGAFFLGNLLIALTLVSSQRAKARDTSRIAALNARLNAILETPG